MKKLFSKNRIQKSKLGSCVDDNKIYNLDKQTIANVLFMKLPKNTKTLSEKEINNLVKQVIDYLAKINGSRFNDNHQNEKINNFVKSYLQKLLIEKSNQAIGLWQISSNDLKNLSFTKENQSCDNNTNQKENDSKITQSQK